VSGFSRTLLIMFLEKGRDIAGARVLRDAASGQVLAGTVELATTRAARRKGLLGRDALARDHALLIAPCYSIHTWFMRFPIDVIFVARDGRVVKTRSAIGPWRMAMALGAYAVVELAAGAIARSPIKTGDRLELITDLRKT
jgi:uncharacterized protein